MLWPGLASPKLGLGLYGSAPFAAFNLASLSFFFGCDSRFRDYLANRPMAVVTAIFVQIVVTLVLVARLARETTALNRGVAPSLIDSTAESDVIIARYDVWPRFRAQH